MPRNSFSSPANAYLFRDAKGELGRLNKRLAQAEGRNAVREHLVEFPTGAILDLAGGPTSFTVTANLAAYPSRASITLRVPGPTSHNASPTVDFDGLGALPVLQSNGVTALGANAMQVARYYDAVLTPSAVILKANS